MAHFERLRDFIERHYRRIAFPALQVTEILLR